jgi:Protein of unknown function (DUF3017)
VTFLKREWALGLVLAVLAVGLLTVAFGYWRRGTEYVGVAVVLAMTLRLVLPTHAVGMLAVRGRIFDAVTMLLIGGAVVVLSILVPGSS